MRLLQAVAAAIALLVSARAASAGDPYLEWFTITTPHFRVHYHSGLAELAQRTAGIAERAHALLAPQLGWEPKQVTDLVISDDSDSANGAAGAIPSNMIRLYVTAPDDMSVLNDYDDWQTELVTHEYTHILHLDNATGIPAIINAIAGKTSAPNQAQPHWILEGLAVAMESAHTSAGRLRSSMFDMYLRADVLAGNLVPLDVMSQDARRWPGGDIWYLYGSKFIEFILDTYGPDTFARVSNEYGAFYIPYGVNRAIRRATGRTYPELYEGWKATLADRYGTQERAIRARGLREGVRFTSSGRYTLAPRFVPRVCSSSGAHEVAYYRDDGETRAGVYRMPVDASSDVEPELLTRATGGTLSVAADCSILFDSRAPTRRRYTQFTDLFRLPDGIRSENGEDFRRQRLTIGERAREPDVSPDGRHVAFVTNAGGTTTLRIADLDATGALSNTRRLVPSARYEQVFTPRFSPDGRRVAYSAWTRGGYRDIRIVDIESGAVTELMHDRAIDQQPVFSPDGKFLFFTSDRGGVANVYAYELATTRLKQVTNVVTGAYMPAISPDGHTLVYVGYTTKGFDLFRMPIEPTNWLEPLPPPERPEGIVTLPTKHYPVTRYDPLPTVRPRRYDVTFGTGSFGRNVLTVSTTGSDAVGHHAYGAAVTFEPNGPEWRGSLDYFYLRLPFDFHAGLFRLAQPQRNYRVGETPETVIEHAYGVTTGLALNIPSEFSWQTLGLSFNASDRFHDAPFGTRVDPWSPVPTEPASGFFTWVHGDYSFSNAESSLYAISRERGLSLALAVEWSGPAIGSEATLSLFSGALTGYVLMPWRHHHVLALAASAASSSGTWAYRNGFSTGGYADVPLIDVYTKDVRQNLLVLRGYDAQQFFGSNFTLLNAEYRFPIVYVDRGISTLPAFLHQVSGTVFADYGGAYDSIPRRAPLDVLHLGAGAELWANLTLGYRLNWTMRFGIAHGFGEAAKSPLQSYFVITTAY